MRRIFLKLLIAVNLLGCLISVSLAEDRIIPITFSVTSTGINRFIASQWGSSTKSWNITYQGVWCSIQLQKPTVSLYSNTIKINLSVTVDAIDISTDLPIYVNQTFRFTPTLTILPTTISMDKIYGQYTDLVAAVAGAISDTRVQGAVAQALSPISWVIYQGKALNESTARWTESSDIGWKGLPTLTFSVANDEVNLTITPTITSATPSYGIHWNRPSRNVFGLRIRTNNYIDIVDLVVVNFQNTIPTNFTSTNIFFEQETGKYVRDYYVESITEAPTSIIDLQYYIRIKRQNTELLWHTYCATGVYYPWEVWINMQDIVTIAGE